ncbi:hypothetical protein [Dyella sp.]|jgi:hypothetical protein|uniref:hypothetical protein n=1 Tax=Dyella sp. TaxID=1869338 RepID=UPI002D76BADE|nr:hypothetical protein [Dyella sp.]HET6431292.1 hypothetical protein [Dyella sp.]
MKRILAMAGTVLLAACGHDVRTPAPLGALVVPNQAPWLILATGPEEVLVRGLDDTIKLSPEPSVATAVEAQLRAGVQPDYFTNLTIACDDLKTQMNVDTDEAPDTPKLDLSLRCTVNARGLIVAHEYSATSTATVAAGSNDAAYGRALGVLLKDAADQIAGKLAADVRVSRQAQP